MCSPVYLFSTVLWYEWDFTFQFNALSVCFSLLLDIKRLPVGVWVIAIF